MNRPQLTVEGPLDRVYQAYRAGRGPRHLVIGGRRERVLCYELDPCTDRLTLIFHEPLALLDRVESQLDLADPTVAAARLDLDARGRPVSVEIKPLDPCPKENPHDPILRGIPIQAKPAGPDQVASHRPAP